ncbi:MAG: isoleucine--tRNA ligase [Clostridia bacterium]|nr:isoleucine--tRNA ligase [Clostridia bacterium]
MYNKVSSNLDFNQRELEIIEFWKQNKIFEKSMESDGEPFTFYDGPPTANGMPHIGHVLTRSIKDLIPRYKTMKGYSSLRKAGWDTHGLPVELEVEKLLGMDGKQDIEKYGIEPFIHKCKESVWKYKGEWEKMSDRVGYWADMDNPYVTYDDNYIESVWWSLKQIDNKGLIYHGHKVVPYCPRCGTALSSHEVAQGYKDVKEKSCYVRFAVKGEENTYLLAWTTTPWTLPSNVALCMHPEIDYVRIKAQDGMVYILAEALVGGLFEEYEVLDTKKGSEYVGMRYEPLFDYVKEQVGDSAYYVVNAEYVTTTDGTGIVHIAPAFGEDDSQVGRKYSLPFVQMIDERGKFKPEAKEYAGMFVKEADRPILMDLAKRGLLFKDMMYEHSYPFCWRCDTPLIYYARATWFIEMTKVRDKLVQNCNSVNWMPASIGTGRMGNFLENVIDWGLSRDRYWGTPLPIWVCDKCGKKHVIGSRQELRELGGLDSDIELHKPYIDRVKWDCECGGTMIRTPEVIDCWYDSGSMPFAQYHYPFENKELFEAHFPADFISEAVDQTRGWFYTLLAISTLIFDRAPFKNCIVLGHVCDKDGQKMSKHKGNVVDPWTVLNSQGADAVRWYFYTGSAPWLPSRFYSEAVSEAQRKYMGTLWNTYAFYVMYAEIDSFDPSKYSLDKCSLTLMDKWILSELNGLVKYIDEGLNEYKITETSRKLAEFTDMLSNWYVRRGRERYWGSDMTDDKISAYMTLYTVLTTIAKLTAPFTPFIAEMLYQNLVRNVYVDAPMSVHLCSFPVADEGMIDTQLNEDMERLLDVVVLGRACRNKANIKNRQPLGKLYLKDTAYRELPDELLGLIADELNVKVAEYCDNDSDFVGYEIKPQLKTIGPKYGALLGKIRAFLADCDATSIVKTVESGESYSVEIDGREVVFTKDDLLISPVNKSGFVAESDKGVTVVLDTNVTDLLKREGISRELVSKLQTMRKDAGFDVVDHIRVGYNASGIVAQVLESDEFGIASDVLAVSISDTLSGYVAEWDIEGKITLSVEKI